MAGKIPAMDDPAAFIQFFKQYVVTASVVVIDYNFISSLIKRSSDSCIYFIGKQFIHPLPVPDIFIIFVSPVFKKTEPCNTFDIGLDINFHKYTSSMQITGNYLNGIKGYFQQIRYHLAFGPEKIKNRTVKNMFHGFKIPLPFGDDQIGIVKLIHKLFP